MDRQLNSLEQVIEMGVTSARFQQSGAFFLCLLCRERVEKRTIRAAKIARTKHKQATGHDISMCMEITKV